MSGDKARVGDVWRDKDVRVSKPRVVQVVALNGTHARVLPQGTGRPSKILLTPSGGLRGYSLVSRAEAPAITTSPLLAAQWLADQDGIVRAKDTGDRVSDADFANEWAAKAMAASPDMARALMAVVNWDKEQRETPEVPVRSPIEHVRAALLKAGVFEEEMGGKSRESTPPSLWMVVYNAKGEVWERITAPETELRAQGAAITSLKGQLGWTCTIRRGTDVVASCSRGLWCNAEVRTPTEGIPSP